ncbi:MAG: putative sugar kinase, ROK family [Candidatus Saccharicenans subterraneus]|uniref:Putative sugar kinase, ROK family n=1 Tax=Candidatus Saccharicenans subterraneus TaxID=2508984 RepID=A0A3E2BLX4_9BACT|nr:MAG: putative sugar kinase, ROK family [Candidatus Saccharicenans subterraneum]
MAIVGVDLGGSNVRAGLVEGERLLKIAVREVRSQGRAEEVLADLRSVLESVLTPEVKGIGLGVPSVVDLETGTIYDVQNIPAWKEVPIKTILESEYNIPVYVNNDANCFAAGEKYFGQGRPYRNLVGLIIGTGLGAGIIADGHLYSGTSCGAGEFGMLPYLDANFERYASGQFFLKSFGQQGRELFQKASAGDQEARRIFAEFGRHLGEAIKAIMYAVDPEAIILGGSVSRAYEFFRESMLETVSTFAYSIARNRIRIMPSTTDNIAILGAAALYLDSPR